MQEDQKRNFITLRLRPTIDNKRCVQKQSNTHILVNSNGTQYKYDRVFGDEDDNTVIYIDFIQKLLDKYLKGCNISIIAYGQTSSEKTYTFQGSQNAQGVIQMALQYLFVMIPNNQQLVLQYVEIYNEKVIDLVNDSNQIKDKYYQQFQKVKLDSMDHFIEIFKQCEQKRKHGATKLNIDSSRSHTILGVILEQENQKQSLLQFIDLAGSDEMQLNSQKRESIMINQSILSFNKLINEISNRQVNDKNYINFRDSCLTFQLEESFTGNCILGFIFTVNQQLQYTSDTIRTLQFSQNLGQVKFDQIRSNLTNRQQNITSEQNLLIQLEQSKNKCREYSLKCYEYERKEENYKIVVKDLQMQLKAYSEQQYQ